MVLKRKRVDEPPGLAHGKLRMRTGAGTGGASWNVHDKARASAGRQSLRGGENQISASDKMPRRNCQICRRACEKAGEHEAKWLGLG